MDKVNRVFFAVPPMVHLLDISGPAHAFYEAAEMVTDLKTYFIGTEQGATQKSSAGLSLSDLVNFNDFRLSSEDWIFVPGIDSELLLSEEFAVKNQAFFDWLKVQYVSGAKICSVCTGTFILAMSGILDGKNCTTHWKYMERFRNRFPRTNWLEDRLFVQDGRIYSSAGVTSGIDLSLYVLEEIYGPILAMKVAKELVLYLRRSKEDPQLSVFLQFRNHLDNRIHEVQDYMAANLDQDLSVESLGEHACMSPRSLSRNFKKTTGITLGEYRDKLRVERAVKMLANGQKLEAVTSGCGLKSSNQLRTLLKKYEGVLPNQLAEY
ncbi:GlxA family transcriptional regulator [Algoriphagus pacificus]|uniref:DJ-1/PfpI family protein n=1 Tax=Algoriphagus pacificus TaxID=2811234 RepID=A0ABS3CGT5_9BACT|nr:DJ-1/PfpI family protein [Algoriphagus pacificus]MBN7816321.1 DJ-1/PfpI family protein [Algoriphagus pacificus]